MNDPTYSTRLLNVESSLSNIREEIARIEGTIQNFELKVGHSERLNTQTLERLEEVLNRDFKESVEKLHRCFDKQRADDRELLLNHMQQFVKKPNFTKLKKWGLMLIGAAVSIPTAEVIKLYIPILLKKWGWYQ